MCFLPCILLPRPPCGEQEERDPSSRPEAVGLLQGWSVDVPEEPLLRDLGGSEGDCVWGDASRSVDLRVCCMMSCTCPTSISLLSVLVTGKGQLGTLLLSPHMLSVLSGMGLILIHTAGPDPPALTPP